MHAPHAVATLVFIHGGYWRSLDKSMFAFVALPFLAKGISVALVGYRLCPEVPLSSVVDDCAAALDWLNGNATRVGLPMYRHAVAGHSAGGHLAVMMFTRRPSPLHRGCCAVASLSGLFELPPLLECSMNADLRMDREMAERMSPTRLPYAHALPLHLEVGCDETAAFRMQSNLLARAWPTVTITAGEVAGANHFTIVDAFAQGGSGAAAFLFAHLMHR
ncbi:MAG: alpha/beta hydrolase [Betaproteobacteria bacterium]|nr:alpha/beta hydrolase [Betaproteobacteria bacterium]